MSDSNPGLMTVFTEALTRLDPAERSAYLDSACGGDDGLRRRVEELLAAHAGAGRFLEPDAARPVEDPTLPSPDGTAAFEPESRPATEMLTREYSPQPVDDVTREERRSGLVTGMLIADRYALVEVIGEGGMGSVYRAEQTEPVKRQVALKLIKAGMDSKGVLARFDAERQALALMDHPNIARIYDGGVTDKGQPYFVMELVQGVPITDFCDQNRLSVRARLELFVSVCQAVQHAHQKGIIHRDLKPGNVLVTEVDGRPTPKVIDFGVAKATEQKLTNMSFSDVGAIVGTPAYMSPEQADPTSMDIDTRSDVYALGVILYELLTGSPPIDTKQFKRGAILEMLRMVREVEPPRPSTKLSTSEALPNIAANRDIDPAKLSKLLQGELDWVVLKALEKDRNRRYDSALGFAQDVQRYLADEVVEARPPSRSYRLKKFIKRNKVQVTAAALVFLALIAGVVGTSLGMVQARNAQLEEAYQRGEAEKARDGEKTQRVKAEGLANANAHLATEKGKLADEKGKLADDNAKLAAEEREAKEETARQLARVRAIVYTNHMTKVAQVIDQNPAEALKLLYDLEPCPVEMRDAAWNVAVKQCQRFLVSTVNPIQIMESFSNSQVATDGSRQATRRVRRDEMGQYWARVTIFDLKTRKEIATTPEYLDEAHHQYAMRLSDDGNKLLILARNDVIPKKDNGNATLETTFRAYACDTATGKLTLIQDKVSLLHERSKFSADGRFLASPRPDNRLELWNIEANKEMHVFEGSGAEPTYAFSPDGRFLAVLGADKRTVLWGLEANEPKHVFKDHARPVYAFSRDGKSFAVGGRDSVVKIWDIASGQLLHTLGAEKLNAAPDFLTFKRDAELREPKGAVERFAGINSLDFSPDGKRLAVACNNWLLEIWDLTSGKLRVTLRTGGGAYGVRFYGDGARLLLGGGTLVDVSTGQTLLTLPGGGRLNKDGRTIVVKDFYNAIKTYDPEVQIAEQAKMTIDKLKLPKPIFALGLRGRLVAVACDDRIELWDTLTGGWRKPLTGHKNPIVALAVSPDGRMLASNSNRQRPPGVITSKTLLDPNAGGSVNDDVHLWNLETNQLIGTFPINQPKVAALAFSPDGKTLATMYWKASNEKGAMGTQPVVVSLWDVATRQTRFSLEFRALNHIVNRLTMANLAAVAFNPTGDTLATGAGRTVLIWNLKTREFREMPAVSVQNSFLRSLNFSPNGETLLAGGSIGLSNVGYSIVYDVRTGKQTGRLKGTGCFPCFSPDGKTIITQNRQTIQFLNPLVLQPIAHLPAHESTVDPVQNIAISPDGQVLAQCIADFQPFDPQHPEAPRFGKLSIRLWDLSRPPEVGTIREVTSRLRFSQDSRTAMIESQDTVKFLDVETLLIRSAVPIGNVVNTASYELSPNGRFFAITGISFRPNMGVEVDVFDTMSGFKIREIRQQAAGYSTRRARLAFAPDNKMLAVAAPPAVSDKPVANPQVAVTIWNLVDGKLLQTIHVPCAAPDPDPTKLSSTLLMYNSDGSALILSYDSEFTVIELKAPMKIVKLALPKELANEKKQYFAGFAQFMHNDKRVVGQYIIMEDEDSGKRKIVKAMWDRLTGQLVDGPIPDIFPDPNKREIVSPNGRYEWKSEGRELIDRWARPPVLVSPPPRP